MYSAAAIGAPNAVRGPQLGVNGGARAAHTQGLIGRVAVFMAGSGVSTVHRTLVPVTRSPK
jgi:hypothetical protein